MNLPSPSIASAAGLAALPAAMAKNIWRAHQLADSATPVMSTGFPLLDRALPGGGWPQSTLIDLAVEQNGCGEMQLLRPVLGTLAQTARQQKRAYHLALIAPPYLPNACLLSHWHMAPDQPLVIQTRNANDRLWAAQQILRHDTCHALLLWHDGKISTAALRQLHLAAQSGRTLLWLLRQPSSMTQSSPAPLRISVRAATYGMTVDIFKRRGAPHAEPLRLTLPDWPRPRVDQTGNADRLATVTGGQQTSRSLLFPRHQADAAPHS